MTVPLQPDDVVEAIKAAPSDEDARAVEAEYVADTGEDDPGEVEDGDDTGDG